MRRVVVTGIGLLSIGAGEENTWNNLNGKSGIKKLINLILMIFLLK